MWRLVPRLLHCGNVKEIQFLKICQLEDFLGSPVVKNLPCRGHGFNPVGGTKIPQASEQLNLKAATRVCELCWRIWHDALEILYAATKRGKRWSSPVVSDPMDCSPAGSSVHGSLQARILEWVAVSFSRGSSQPWDRTWVFCIVGRLLTGWAMREVHN